jgi:hypothetical protein
VADAAGADAVVVVVAAALVVVLLGLVVVVAAVVVMLLELVVVVAVVVVADVVVTAAAALGVVADASGSAAIARIVIARAERRRKCIWTEMTCELSQTFPDSGVAWQSSPTRGGRMSRLIRMDRTGHTTLAEWNADDPAAVEAALAAFRAELDQGYFAVVSRGEGHAEQVHELPVDAPMVILRRPIAGG